MLIYVSHKYGGDLANVEKAKKVTHDLQMKDTKNGYICPLNAFSHIAYNEIGYEEEMQMCLDLLSVCDMLLVASEISTGVLREIEFAKERNMKIIYLEERSIGYDR